MKNVIEHTHISRSLVFEMEYLHTPTHTKKYSFMFLTYHDDIFEIFKI